MIILPNSPATCILMQVSPTAHILSNRDLANITVFKDRTPGSCGEHQLTHKRAPHNQHQKQNSLPQMTACDPEESWGWTCGQYYYITTTQTQFLIYYANDPFYHPHAKTLTAICLYFPQKLRRKVMTGNYTRTFTKTTQLRYKFLLQDKTRQ